MLVLLPPSEGKTAPPEGPPVDLASLSHPELVAHRQRIGDALIRVSGSRNGAATLGVGTTLTHELAHNPMLWSNPAAPAARVYPGVLYDAARMATWDAPTLDRASRSVRIVSALWGAVSPADAIPAYRLSMSTTLPRIGGLGSWWSARLGPSLDALAEGSVIVDCRSSAYLAAWKPRAGAWVTVRVEKDVEGKRTVVSHMAKHARGLLVGALLREATPPSDPEAVAQIATRIESPHEVSVELKRTAKGPAILTIVEHH